MADGFDAYVRNQARPQPQQEGTALGGFIGDVTNMVQDRWWKKEAEEFKESAGQEFQEMLSRIGQLTSDETFEDINGLWTIYSSGIKKFMDRVSEYPKNPYISQYGQNMFNFMQNQFGSLTEGVQAQHRMQIASAQEEREQLAAPGKRRLTEAQAKYYEEGGRRGAATRITGLTFGKTDLFNRMSPAVHLDTIKQSKAYQNMRAAKIRQQAAERWEATPPAERFTLATNFDQFVKSQGLSEEDELELDREALNLHFNELYGATRTPFEVEAMVDKIMGPKHIPTRDNVDRALTGRIPTGTPIPEGSASSAKASFMTDEELPEDIFENPPEPSTMREKYGDSPAGRVATEYWRLRSQDKMSHGEAVEHMFRSEDHGGSGFIDRQTIDVFEGIGYGNKVTDASISNWRRDLLKMLRAYEDYYEGEQFQQELSREEQEEFTRTGKIPRLLGKRAAHGFKRLVEEIFEPEERPGEEMLAREGLRTEQILAPVERPELRGTVLSDQEEMFPELFPRGTTPP